MKLMFDILEKLHELPNNLVFFYQNEWKLEKMRNLQVTFKENRIKRISCVHKNFKRISNVWILVCPHETETSRKKKIILPGYR